MSDIKPCLTIRYSTDFSISIQFSSTQCYEVAATDCRFNFTCRVLHPTGEFTYTASDIYIDLSTFRDFVEQLEAIRNEKAVQAKFHDYGHMIEFSLDILERKARASLRIREFQPGGELTLLSAGFQVDYDLFVNALHDKTTEFLAELASADLV